MLCVMKRRNLPGLREICAGCGRIAVLENVMNPTNVGAIFRSAAALHMDAVIRFTEEQAGSVWGQCSKFRGHLWIDL
jgi:tRNA G18 (ribose-2'-O)-methylase SpoU